MYFLIFLFIYPSVMIFYRYPCIAIYRFVCSIAFLPTDYELIPALTGSP